jgi:hypothetical protein
MIKASSHVLKLLDIVRFFFVSTSEKAIALGGFNYEVDQGGLHFLSDHFSPWLVVVASICKREFRSSNFDSR